MSGYRDGDFDTNKLIAVYTWFYCTRNVLTNTEIEYVDQKRKFHYECISERCRLLSYRKINISTIVLTNSTYLKYPLKNYAYITECHSHTLHYNTKLYNCTILVLSYWYWHILSLHETLHTIRTFLINNTFVLWNNVHHHQYMYK